MPFLLLLFLTIACLPDQWEAPGDWIGTPGRSAALTWTSMAAVVAMAGLVSARVRRRLVRDPGRRDLWQSRYSAWRLYHALMLFGLYATALYLFGWGWAVQNLLGLGPSLFPGGELIVLAPFLTALVLSWAFFYDAERALHGPASADEAETYWSRWDYVGFCARHNLALVLIPILLLVVEKGIRRLFPYGENSWFNAASYLGFVAAVVLFACIPWILRLVLGLKPLPEGPLRSRLLAASRRLHFRCNDILLWSTRGGVANAMVAGILPMPRYVVLTDRLVSDLTADEVEAVFGHEVGHVKHHHMLLYFGFLMISMAALWFGALLFWPSLEAALHLSPKRQDLGVLPLVLGLGTYIFVVFGFLSRRCERQADIYGCRAVSCGRSDCQGHDAATELAPRGRGLCPTGIGIFIDALEKVARLNGISRERPGWLQSWQHSTIARRVEFLQQMRGDPSVEPRFQRRVLLVKWALLLGLGAILLVLTWLNGGPSVSAHGIDTARALPVTPHTEGRTAPSE